jgi:hypothetical protein
MKSRAMGAIVDDLKATAAMGPTPEFLRLMIEQTKVDLRAAARRNDPDPMPAATVEMIRDRLKHQREQLPLQIEAWRLRRHAERQAAFARMMDRHDPAERKATIDAINDSFRDRPVAPWQDDMTGVADPNSIGAAE